MMRVVQSILAVVAAAAFLAGCQTMDNRFLTGFSDIPPPSSSSPETSAPAATPAGFISFCLRNTDQCTTSNDQPQIAQLDQPTWMLLQRVNDEVNRAIRPLSDQRHYGRVEVWGIPTDGYGDCDEYVLTKRKALIEAGLPDRALRIAVVSTRRGELHAVLTVTTDKGDYVLDNITGWIVPWTDTGYTWLKRQDPNRPLGWASLTTGT